MNTHDVLQTLSELPNRARLIIAQAALSLMGKDWQFLFRHENRQSTLNTCG